MSQKAACPRSVPTRSENYQMLPREWALLILLATIWGSSFPFIKTALTAITPITVVFIRLTFGALILLAAAAASRQRLPADPRRWLSFVIMAVLSNVIPFNMIAWGLQHIDSSLGSILNATTPIFSVILVQILTREDRLTTSRIAGIALGWIGIALMIGLGSLSSFGQNVGSLEALLAQFALLGASCAYALAAIYGRNRFRDLPPVVTSASVLLSAAVLTLPIALLFESPLELRPEIIPLLSAAVLGLLCTGIAYLIYYRLLMRVGPTNVLLVTLLVPVSTIILSIVFLGESLDRATIIGSVVLFGGLAAIDGRLVRRLKRRRSS